MKLQGRLCVVALGILAWSPLSVMAQPAADKPGVKVGDKWTFKESVKTSASGESNGTWSRRIVEILPDDRMQVAGGKDQLILVDGTAPRSISLPNGKASLRRNPVVSRQPESGVFPS